MKVTFDSKGDVAYIQIADHIPPGSVAKTYPCDPVEAGGMINLDFDAEGRLLGIEVLGAASRLPREVLSSFEPEEDRESERG